MKIAVIQFNAGVNKEKNVSRALVFVKKALKRGAKFVVLPEVFHYRGGIKNFEELSSIKEVTSGPTIRAVKELAKAYKSSILAGSIYEAVKGQKKVYNTSVLIDGNGRIVAKYRKMNLFEASVGNVDISESRRFLKGKKEVIGKVKDFKVGLSICYDVRFPEMYRKYCRLGAHILCVPSAFTKMTGQYHWEILLRARAIENMCYVLAPNQCGKDNKGIVHYGNSMIIDPWGKVLARASGKKEEILYAEVDKKVFKGYSKVLPSIRN